MNYFECQLTSAGFSASPFVATDGSAAAASPAGAASASAVVGDVVPEVGDVASSDLAGFCLSFLPKEMLRKDHFFLTLSFLDLDLMLSSASGVISSPAAASLGDPSSPLAVSATASPPSATAALFSVVRSLSFSECSSVSFFYWRKLNTSVMDVHI